jgi:hypothetical protein
MTFVTSLLVATAMYAATYVQGWVGTVAPKPTAKPACQPASARPVRPGDVTINVYNTTVREGLAASVARSLRRQGFKVGTVGNDPLGLSIRGVGEIRHGQAGAAGATLTTRRISGAKVVQDNRPDATVDVVLGSAFKAVRPRSKGEPPVVAKPTQC